jgi:hypothetical protein
MKRSEVVKYIYHSIKVLDDYNRFEEKELMEFSEKLLTGLEENIGMNPPYNSWVDDEEDGCFWEPEE